jgi:hypothetical protein
MHTTNIMEDHWVCDVFNHQPRRAQMSGAYAKYLKLICTYKRVIIWALSSHGFRCYGEHITLL